MTTNENCTTVDRDQLTWDWNGEHVINLGNVTLVKPAGGHNNIQVVGNPDKITIFSNGGTQDRTGQTVLTGDYGSDIQWVEVCYAETSTPPVVEPEEPPVLNDPVFQWVSDTPVIDCEGMTVTIVSHEEAAGWYWGNDGEQYLGGFFPTGNETNEVRPATAEECPTPPVNEEEEPAPGEETPTTPEENTPNTNTETTSQPVKKSVETQTLQPVSNPQTEQLAVTGSGLEWTALIIGVVFVVAGLALYLKRSKR